MDKLSNQELYENLKSAYDSKQYDQVDRIFFKVLNKSKFQPKIHKVLLYYAQSNKDEIENSNSSDSIKTIATGKTVSQVFIICQCFVDLKTVTNSEELKLLENWFLKKSELDTDYGSPIIEAGIFMNKKKLFMCISLTLRSNLFCYTRKWLCIFSSSNKNNIYNYFFCCNKNNNNHNFQQ